MLELLADLVKLAGLAVLLSTAASGLVFAFAFTIHCVLLAISSTIA